MKRTNKIARCAARGGIVAALYVTLTAISAMAGLSNGVIQIRISEAMCILPLFMPEASVGLFIGCLVSNLVFSGVIWDVIFGSLATLIGALGAYAMRRIPEKLAWAATLPTVIANVLIIPPVLIFAYGVPDTYLFICATVGIGEIVSATVGGTALYKIIRKTKLKI